MPSWPPQVPPPHWQQPPQGQHELADSMRLNTMAQQPMHFGDSMRLQTMSQAQQNPPRGNFFQRLWRQ